MKDFESGISLAPTTYFLFTYKDECFFFISILIRITVFQNKSLNLSNNMPFTNSWKWLILTNPGKGWLWDTRASSLDLHPPDALISPMLGHQDNRPTSLLSALSPGDWLTQCYQDLLHARNRTGTRRWECSLPGASRYVKRQLCAREPECLVGKHTHSKGGGRASVGEGEDKWEE